MRYIHVDIPLARPINAVLKQGQRSYLIGTEHEFKQLTALSAVPLDSRSRSAPIPHGGHRGPAAAAQGRLFAFSILARAFIMGYRPGRSDNPK
jgi:hypothetical protein